ncbi:hypothetical protein GZH52_09255 [Crenobacter sp. HX-7-9]|uniref:Uncharacterized protein n=1 Tax=Crenobacter caeni TaxID=2705474 RepID=A0A6B2KSR7_9NEIS|nr:hypothetical protein [Crenobacter caeni]
MIFHKKKNRLVRWVTLFGVAVLSACAAPHNPNVQLNAWVKANPVAAVQGALIIDVPVAGNAIADAMMVASLKAGVRSNVVDAIVEMLERPPAGLMLVSSRDADLAAATLESALRAVAGRATAGHRVVLLGSNPVPQAVLGAAGVAGVSVEAGPSPQR